MQCPVGTYQNQVGQTNCTDCAIGSYQNAAGQMLCKTCPAGKFQNVTGMTSCIDCEIGHYQDSTGKSSCKECLAGTYQNSVAQKSCIDCPVGHFQNLTGSNTCIACEAGTYQNYAGKSACIACGVGYFQNETAKIYCYPCDLGTSQNLTGQSGCTSCAAGYYQNKKSKPTCIECPIGTFQNTTGSSYCMSCDIGHYQNLTGQTSCTECPAGSYQSSQRSSQCYLCDYGTIQPLAAQSSCSKCLVGEYQSTKGNTTCLTCPDGTYSSTNGSIICHNCPTDYYPTADKKGCLYKALYSTIAEFGASQFKAKCFNSTTGAIIKPFTAECRTAYHEVCCTGSTNKTGIDCNLILEIQNTALRGSYCTACPFMNYTVCPADGVCWNDLSWTVNNQDPYITPPTNECLDSVKEYCYTQFKKNINSAECIRYFSICGGDIVGSAYLGDWRKFTLKFNKEFNANVADCSTFIDTSSSALFTGKSTTCSKATPWNDSAANATLYGLEVDISTLNAPVLEFTTRKGAICNRCGQCLSNVKQVVSPPDPPLESLTTTYGTFDDKCSNLTINLTIDVIFQ